MLSLWKTNTGELGPAAERAWLSGAALHGVTLAITCYVLLFPLQDYDTFWHLAYGRAMVDAQQFINHEIFSYTAPGTPLFSHSQLAQVILYLLYRAFGADGLLIFKLLAALAVYWLVVRTAKLFEAPAAVAAAIGLLAMVAGMSRFVERPELFSILGLAWLVDALYRYTRSGGGGGKEIFVLPVIFVLWDYLHGAVYGLAFLGAFVAGETLKYLAAPRVGWLRSRAIPLPTRGMRRLWLWAGITLGATLLHPNGLLHYEGFWRVSSLAGDFGMYGEWARPAFGSQFFGYWVWLALVLLLVVMSLRRIDLTMLITLLPFAYLSLQYNRATLSFCLVAVPLVAKSLTSVCTNGIGSPRLKAMAPLLFLLLVAGTTIVYKAGFTIDNFKPGMGVNENVFPAGSVRFVKEAGLTGNLYNMDGFGGYLAYHLGPERKIFHYNQPGVFTALPDYVHKPETRARWNINYAIIGKAEELQMFEREGFVPVYWEPTAMVLLRPAEDNRALLESYRIRYFKPLLSDQQYVSMSRVPAIAEQLYRETATYLAFRHDRRIGALFGKSQTPANPGAPLTKRREWLEKAARYNDDNAALLTSLAEVCYRLKDLSGADRYYREVLRLDPGDLAAQLGVGYILYDQQDYLRAIDQFTNAVQQHPDDASVHYGLALSLFRNGDHGRAKEAFENFLRLAPESPFAEKARAFLAEMPWLPR